MEVLIPSVMALRETAMTAPLDQQGEPLRSAGSSRNIRGIATPVCGLVRNDNSYFGAYQVPRQCEHWLAMTYVILFRSKNRTIPSGTQRYHADRPAMHALAVGSGWLYGIVTKPFNIV